MTISSQMDPFLEQLRTVMSASERKRESNKETRFGHEPNDSIRGRKLQLRKRDTEFFFSDSRV